jgi:hypothetical protein
MFQRACMFAAAIALASAGCAGNTKPAKSPRSGAVARKPVAPARVPKAPEWVPDTSLLDQLSVATEVLGNPDCTIRPPASYQLQPLEVSPGVGLTGARWASPVRPDGTQHRLLVMIGRRPPGEAAEDLGHFATNVLGSRSRIVGPVQQQPVEYGLIKGLRFALVRWSAKNPSTGQQTRGFVYVATPGQTDIMIDSQELEPHEASTLRVAEASAGTFRFGGTGR